MTDDQDSQENQGPRGTALSVLLLPLCVALSGLAIWGVVLIRNHVQVVLVQMRGESSFLNPHVGYIPKLLAIGAVAATVLTTGLALAGRRGVIRWLFFAGVLMLLTDGIGELDRI